MVTSESKISIVAALSAHDRGIGNGDKLLWRIPEDLKRFKALTLGHPIIMGRKTYESVVSYLGGPLPGRANIVLTRSGGYNGVGKSVSVRTTIEAALARAAELDRGEVFVGGGAEVYAEALPYANRLYLTLIDDEKKADAFFPPYENTFVSELSREEREHDGLSYAFVTLERG